MDDQAKARVVQAAQAPKRHHGGIPPFAIFVILFFVFSMLGSLGRRGRGGGLGAALPWIILDSLNNRGGGWGGGGGGWGGGGGGFSGGGGSFGGGGSSGSW